MSKKRIYSVNYNKKKFGIIPEPAAAWTAILAFSLGTTILIFTGAGAIANLFFPLGSAVIGVFLYFRYPVLYNGFVWWIWFLVALVRRLADYYNSYTEPSPLLLAPYLVTGITLITVFKYLPKVYQVHRQGLFAFTLPLIGIAYGFLIGLINLPTFTVIRSLLDWLVPVSYGFHLLVNWHIFSEYQRNIKRVFIWGILVMGIYGIFQYVSIPEWDRFWLNNAEINSIGLADNSGGTRIWSTMHSVEPFAAFMAGGLLLLLEETGILSISASGFGYLAFLLTNVRSAWIGWFTGVITLFGTLKAKYKIRLIIYIAIIAILVVPLATMEQFSENIGQRFESFSNLEKDTSAIGRQEFFKTQIIYALTNFTGDGIGTPAMDSALLSGLTSLGWFGSICYFGGLFLLVSKIFQDNKTVSNPFLNTACAIVITCLIRLPLNISSVAGQGGMLLWGFLALAIASVKFELKSKI